MSGGDTRAAVVCLHFTCDPNVSARFEDRLEKSLPQTGSPDEGSIRLTDVHNRLTVHGLLSKSSSRFPDPKEGRNTSVRRESGAGFHEVSVNLHECMESRVTR